MYSQWPFSVVPLIVAISMSESPVHLVRKNKLEAALKAPKRQDRAAEDSQGQIEQLQAPILDEARVGEFGGEQVHRLLQRRQQTPNHHRHVCGHSTAALWTALLGDGPYFLQITGMCPENSLIFLIFRIVGGLIGPIISMWLLTVFGRRKLCLVTLAPLILLWLGSSCALSALPL